MYRMMLTCLLMLLPLISQAEGVKSTVQQLEQRVVELEAAIPLKRTLYAEPCTDSGQFADWVLSDGSPQIVDFGFCPDGISVINFKIRDSAITPDSFVDVLVTPQNWNCRVFFLWHGQAWFECDGPVDTDAIMSYIVLN